MGNKIVIVRRIGRSGKIWISEKIRKDLEGKYVIITIEPLQFSDVKTNQSF